jgi:hypothetical protein
MQFFCKELCIYMLLIYDKINNKKWVTLTCNQHSSLPSYMKNNVDDELYHLHNKNKTKKGVDNELQAPYCSNKNNF